MYSTWTHLKDIKEPVAQFLEPGIQLLNKKPGYARLFHYYAQYALDDITTFIVLCNIETFCFFLVANTQTENGINHFQNHKRNDCSP